MKKFSFLFLLSPALLLASNYSVQFGYKTTAYDYTETTSTGVLDTEESDLSEINGLYVNLIQRLWKNSSGGDDSIECYFSHTEGNTDYIGSLLGSGQPYGSYRSITANTYDDVQLNFRRTVPANMYDFFILAGMGYYEWERALSVTQIETYRWYYAQMSVGVNKSIRKGLKVGVDLTAQHAFNQEMHANIPGTIVATFDLGKTYTYKAGIPLTLSVSDTVDFTARLEYEYTEIGRSNVISGFYEPDSEQKNVNLYLGVNLRF